ncbi:MAG: indolepyruvate oxidoreductase subunit beta [Rikenellaceae bacterium]|nr:indolepyruvate oxidoreductase subunit beta [Rikenellaceae bacterium]
MNKIDIILAGVGGQGILTIATIIGDAAAKAGLYLKQAEVHGMSQRGGDVQSNLRLSCEPIYSDLIREGQADMIISMEPMEALRYVACLNGKGRIITSSTPFKNIPNYPDEQTLMQELQSLPNVTALPIEEMAKDGGFAKSANVVLLGMAARYLGVLTADQLRQSIENVFKSKGEAVVEANLQAFELGVKAAE